MKPLIHWTLCVVLCWGCSPSSRLPEYLPQGYFIPTLAAAAALTTESNAPVTPSVPDNPTGVCPNCNGKGRVGDGTVETICVVCDGTGKVTSDKMSGTLPSSPPRIEANPSRNISVPEKGVSIQAEETGQPPPPPADQYTAIEYVPVEQVLDYSRMTGKPIWIHIYADGWCAECKRLDEQVFNQKEVIKESRKFVCAKVEWEHPWRAALVGGTNGVPLDVFGTPGTWKNLKKFYCPKTPESYVRQLSSQSKVSE